MGKRKHKRAAKNARKGMRNQEEPELVKAPHSFVIHRGKLGRNANELMLNFRKIMEPYTATRLKVKKQNVLKDFVHIAGPLNVTHLVVFTKTENFMYLRIGKLPRGPTLSFRIVEYSLSRDVISSQKKSIVYEKLFLHHPLLVLNNFTGEGMHFKLMTTMFQNMFPSINVNKTRLDSIRRCLLLNYNSDKTIDLRHYAIKVVPTGVSKAVKKLIQNKVPNLGHYKNVDEFIEKSGNLSESEVEMDSAVNTVVLPQQVSSRGNIVSEKSAVRLYEIGPRFKLQLIKIEEGLMSGEVMFHEFIVKTPEEISKLKAKRRLQEQKKAKQKQNIERKKKQQENKSSEDSDDEGGDEGEEEEDREWYRKEVGEDPEFGLTPRAKRRKLPSAIRGSKKAKSDGRKANADSVHIQESHRKLKKQVRFALEKKLKSKTKATVSVYNHKKLMKKKRK